MATIPTLTFSDHHDEFIYQLISHPLPSNADLFDVADFSAAFASVLVETDDAAERNALCGRLLNALMHLEKLCENDLPVHLIDKLSAEELPASTMPDCWQETDIPVSYAIALTQALLGNNLPDPVEKALTGLLHDLVYLLAEYVKEPYLPQH
jgi:hypothetical protein